MRCGREIHCRGIERKSYPDLSRYFSESPDTLQVITTIDFRFQRNCFLLEGTEIIEALMTHPSLTHLNSSVRIAKKFCIQQLK